MTNSRLYKYSGFWWKCEDYKASRAWYRDIDGPFCLACYAELEFPEDVVDGLFQGLPYDEVWTGELTCNICSKKHKLRITIRELKDTVSSKLKAGYLSQLEKISLDEPITQVKVRDQDEKYFLAAKISQKNGKRVGIVYFGEKNKDQNKKDYSQIFIDIDDEQIRFDKSNMVPKEILARMKVEFSETVIEEKYRKTIKK